MPLFGEKKPSAAEEAARAEVERLQRLSPADLAVELMAEFGPDGPRGDVNVVDETRLLQWATRFGLASLANGTDAVRQRIKDRTGLWPIEQVVPTADRLSGVLEKLAGAWATGAQQTLQTLQSVPPARLERAT